MGIFSSISNANASGHGIALIYAGMLGLLLSDIIPTPADAGYFWYQRKLNEEKNNGKITPKQYWVRDAAAYYLLNPIWWFILIVIVANIKGPAEKKLKVAAALIAIGLVFAVIYKNIKKDEESLAAKTVK